MLTKLIIRNFKGFENAEIELGNPVVFVGANDSGKTTALQALTLWDLGLRTWTEIRGESASPGKPGVALSRRDLVGVPVPSALHLWREAQAYRKDTSVLIEVIVEGITGREQWSCGLEFQYYNNAEIFHCRPLRTVPDGSQRMPVLPQELRPKLALLNPMSGLVSNETVLQPGAIDVRLGEGRTAEVLRNLCMRVTELPDGQDRWSAITDQISRFFGVRLDPPRSVPTRGEVEVTYRTRVGAALDLTAAGRGMQQTLLLLAFINLHPDSVLLLDEPDAHLEILRQKQTYGLLQEVAAENRTQVICASHSEVVLNEAIAQDTVIAFVGPPHRIESKEQVLKALRDIGFEDYYQSEITGFVLYLEGSTDLSLLRAFAQVLEHDALRFLERPFVKYVGNQVKRARDHFHGLREAKPDLIGYALFDRLDTGRLVSARGLTEHMWPRREIENYLLPLKTLPCYAEQRDNGSVTTLPSGHPEGETGETSEATPWRTIMDRVIGDFVPPIALRDPQAQYWIDTKVSDRLLKPVLDAFFTEVGLPPLLRKKNYHHLVRCLDQSEVHQDVVDVLDAVVTHASRGGQAHAPLP